MNKEEQLKRFVDEVVLCGQGSQEVSPAPVFIELNNSIRSANEVTMKALEELGSIAIRLGAHSFCIPEQTESTPRVTAGFIGDLQRLLDESREMRDAATQLVSRLSCLI